ncbi:unnamed protein product [Symbiodinium sp. CCMP2592]|nr:unnamed protein product [Symbiodinium sp. CCMP2592]
MKTIAQLLANVLVCVINLERQQQRRETTVQLLESCGFSRIGVLPAIDGQKLFKSGGRLMKQNKIWRISCDSYDQTIAGEATRITDRLRVFGLAPKGGTNVWAQFGFMKSHEPVLHMVRRDLPKEKLVLVCEEDLLVPNASWRSAELVSVLGPFIEQLTKECPRWVSLLLGGTPVFGYAGKNAPTGITGINKAGCVMQSHDCGGMQRRATSY